MICPYPMQSEQIEKVAVALGGAQRDLAPMGKDGRGFNDIRFVTFESLREAVLPCLASHGLSIVQFMMPWPGEVQQLSRSEVKKNERWQGKDKQIEHQQFVVPVATVGLFRTQIIHTTGQWMASDWPILADWSNPKDVGAIVGHFKRYAIECLLGIAKADEPPPPGRGDRGNRAQSSRQAVQSQPPAASSGVAPPWASSGPGAADGAPSVAATSGPPIIPAVGDDEHLSDLGEEIDPGSSGPAFHAWLYDRGGCEDPSLGPIVLAMALGQRFPEDVTEWTPEQAARGFEYARKKIERARRSGVAPTTNGFRELPPIVTGVKFNEFAHTNGA